MLGGRWGLGVMTSGGHGGVCKCAKRRVQVAIGGEGKAGRLTLDAREDNNSRWAGSKVAVGAVWAAGMVVLRSSVSCTYVCSKQCAPGLPRPID